MRTWLPVAALVAAVFLAYQPAWLGRFLWDDDTHLLNNPVLSPGGLQKAWLSGEYLNYWPVTFTVYWLEFKAWGLDPLGYHLINIALHAAAAILVWRVLQRLQIPGAMLAAAIFALHPVNVESVAWIAQLKNVLSLFLALSAVLFYLGHEREGRWQQLAAAIAFFLLSVLAKGMMLTLPVVLLACAWWQRGRIDRRDLLRVLPFVIISAVFVCVEVGKQHTGMGDAVVRSDGLLSRAAVAGCAVWFYLWKVIWPFNLLFIYPRWSIGDRDVWAYLPGTLLLMILAIAWWQWRSSGRPVVMLLVCYVALLLPVLGFANIIFMRYSLVADHWQYAAMIVPCAALAGLLATLMRRVTPKSLAVSWILSVVMLAILAMLTSCQSSMYADEETLYRMTLRGNPDCWLAHNNLGNLLKNEGQIWERQGQIDRATALYNEAIDHYHAALKASPGDADTQLNLGVAWGCLGQNDKAITYLRDALKARPESVGAHYNLAMALVKQSKIEEAIGHYHRVLEINHDDRPTLNNLAWLRATYPDPEYRDAKEAVKLAERSLDLWKGHQPPAQVLDTLAAAYANASRFDDAMRAGRRALDLATLQQSPQLAAAVKARVMLYAERKAYRQPAATSDRPER